MALTGRTEALLRSIKDRQVVVFWLAVIPKSQVGRLVVVVVGASQSHRGEQIETDLAIRLGVVDGLTLSSGLKLVVVCLC